MELEERGIDLMALTEEEHKKRHIELHKAFDELLADYLDCNRGMGLESTLYDLAKWSHRQCTNPDKSPNEVVQ